MGLSQLQIAGKSHDLPRFRSNNVLVHFSGEEYARLLSGLSKNALAILEQLPNLHMVFNIKIFFSKKCTVNKTRH